MAYKPQCYAISLKVQEEGLDHDVFQSVLTERLEIADRKYGTQETPDKCLYLAEYMTWNTFWPNTPFLGIDPSTEPPQSASKPRPLNPPEAPTSQFPETAVYSSSRRGKVRWEDPPEWTAIKKARKEAKKAKKKAAAVAEEMEGVIKIEDSVGGNEIQNILGYVGDSRGVQAPIKAEESESEYYEKQEKQKSDKKKEAKKAARKEAGRLKKEKMRQNIVARSVVPYHPTWNGPPPIIAQPHPNSMHDSEGYRGITTTQNNLPLRKHSNLAFRSLAGGDAGRAMETVKCELCGGRGHESWLSCPELFWRQEFWLGNGFMTSDFVL
ncbi:hypothetical protein BDZ45DRAFT_694817 [Acephala macrosclerotiorum]|nr:hypothetical protein BDZ45DRAFT_694817 [Acephala macrosclerotiorum]